MANLKRHAIFPQPPVIPEGDPQAFRKLNDYLRAVALWAQQFERNIEEALGGDTGTGLTEDQIEALTRIPAADPPDGKVWKGKDGVGEWGTDEVATVGIFETIYCSYSADVLPSQFRPDNSWGYQAGGSKTHNSVTVTWSKNPTALSNTNRYRFAARRAITGSPEAGDAVSANWGLPYLSANLALNGIDGVDGEDGNGVEYIFASSTDGAAITGTANLPDPDWNFNVVSATGTTRGTQKYYDGTPTDLSATRPFMIRFRRPVPGTPAQNADIGTVAWIQEKAVRVYGSDGTDGSDGAGIEYIFASSTDGTAISGDENLPDPDWNFNVVSATGTTRGTQKYYDGTPTDLSATRPFMIRFRRPVPGTPAQNEDIGTVAWIQEAAVRVYGERGLPGSAADVEAYLNANPVTHTQIGPNSVKTNNIVVDGTLVSRFAAIIELSASRIKTGELSAERITGNIQNARTLFSGEVLAANRTLTFTLPTGVTLDNILFGHSNIKADTLYGIGRPQDLGRISSKYGPWGIRISDIVTGTSSRVPSGAKKIAINVGNYLYEEGSAFIWTNAAKNVLYFKAGTQSKGLYLNSITAGRSPVTEGTTVGGGQTYTQNISLGISNRSLSYEKGYWGNIVTSGGGTTLTVAMDADFVENATNLKGFQIGSDGRVFIRFNPVFPTEGFRQFATVSLLYKSTTLTVALRELTAGNPIGTFRETLLGLPSNSSETIAMFNRFTFTDYDATLTFSL